MYKEPDAMREIHKIRENLYKEEKELTVQELIAEIHKEAEEVRRKYNLKFRETLLPGPSLAIK